MQPKFKVGDAVFIIRKPSQYYNKCVKITRVIQGNDVLIYEVDVVYRDKKGYLCLPDDIALESNDIYTRLENILNAH